MVRFTFTALALLVGIANVASAGGGSHGHGGHSGHHHRNPQWAHFVSCPPRYCPAPAPAVDDDEEPKQIRRILAVKNDTEETLTVFVRYRVKNHKGDWSWTPGKPDGNVEPLAFELAPGEEAVLSDDDTPIRSSKVRIWAVGQKSEDLVLGDKDEDLWLVPEMEDDEHCYRAAEMETYTVTFSK